MTRKCNSEAAYQTGHMHRAVTGITKPAQAISSEQMVKHGNILALLGLPLSVTAASAHHSFAMFDMSKSLTFHGVVLGYNRENPHTQIIVEVPESEGKETAGTWDIEGGAVNIMVKQGWAKTTFKAGDNIAVIGHPMKDGSKAASLFYVILPDGKRLHHDVARLNADGSPPSPQP